MSARAAGPFSPRVGTFLALVGIVLFVFALWAMGGAMDRQNDSAPGAAASGRGFNGYAAMAQFLEKRGYAVETLRSEAQMRQGGLLIIFPPHRIDNEALDKIVAAHRRAGPVIVVLPKWKQTRLSGGTRRSKGDGRKVVNLIPSGPQWPGWHNEITLDLSPMQDGPKPGTWTGLGAEGTVPESGAVLSAQSDSLIPLVASYGDGRVLAGYIPDDGDYPALREAARPYASAPPGTKGGENKFPLILVFEPDLLNNYGFARVENARLAERLVQAALGGGEKRVLFDGTMAGADLQQDKRNLLTEAFRPPFLAATICLLLAVMVAFWRALHRFGPPLLAARSIAFGKRALLANGAGLVQRARRLHLLGAPYADAARERLARALALPARLNPEAAEKAIDRALAFREPHAVPFSQAAAQMRAARRPVDLLRAARLIHSLERTLKR